MNYTFLATAAFGLEGVAANELKRMDIAARAENGGARFEGTLLDGYRANLCLRTADRVMLVLAEELIQPRTLGRTEIAQNQCNGSLLRSDGY